MQLECPHCGNYFATEPSNTPGEAICPGCAATITVPASSPEPPPLPVADNATIYCRQCGQPNASTHRHCTRCGRSLDSQTIYVAQGASGVEAVIPITNPSSLWAYYLGVFSLIPCLGIPLGIAALVCGIKGLAMSKTLPRNAGRLHSWAGMVLGAFFAILYLVLTVFAVAGISSTLKPQ